MKFFSSLPLVLASFSTFLSLSSGSEAAPNLDKNQTAYHGPLSKVPKNKGTIQLGAFIYDEFDLLDVMGPMRVFGEAQNELNIKINFIASSMKPIKSTQQVMVTPHYTLSSAPKMDFFFMPGGDFLKTVTEKPAVMQQIRARVKDSTWTMTVCTGAGILAKTGLMNGFKMTTNKSAFKLVVDYGIDAALFVVSQLVNQTIAEKVANYIEYSWHKDANDDPFADLYPYTRS
ncbi:hypothetical protein EC968_010489 [Mortierella alpina]|nr:hypothetical protein EC968_010489 [Mortierella alpina]